MEISKSDWKKYREKISGWQEHYMERLVEEYITFLSSDQPASDKFWELEKRIKQDKKCPGVLIEMRKSSAIYDIVRLIGDKVISLDDFEEFSDDLKEAVKFLIERWQWVKSVFCKMVLKIFVFIEKVKCFIYNFFSGTCKLTDDYSLIRVG